MIPTFQIDSRLLPIILPIPPKDEKGILLWAKNLMQALNTERKNRQEIPNALAVGPLDLEITDPTKGVILTSPDGTRWRIKVDNAGTLTVVSL